MAFNDPEAAAKIREYILAEFLAGEDPSQLEDATPLITSGVLDSIATLRLVSFLEKEFGISIEAHEAGSDYLDSIASAVALVRSKLE